jgi:hypothetical protein
MQEPAFATTGQRSVAFTRFLAAVDALSSVIAGFALLAGARAFMFTALLGWREPVLGGAGLVLLALIGWLRWQCGGAGDGALTLHPAAAPPHGGDSETARARTHGLRIGTGSPGTTLPLQLACAGSCNVACYNRSKRCDSTCCIDDAPRQCFGPARTQA